MWKSTGLLLLLGQLGICSPPNILFILTDDQDWHMESVNHMQYLKSLVVDEGLTYNQHYCTVALCCPSRASLWTGKAAHNHNVTNVSPPHGGYPKVVSEGVNDDNLFLWMQEAGYQTYYVGKLWNFHSVDNYDQPFARGFNGSEFLLDPYTYQYWNAQLSRNGERPVSYAGQYSTDVVATKSLGFLREALEKEDPFFLTVAPIAPHSNWVIKPEEDLSYLEEPKSAPRHQHLFQDYKIPRTESFNAPVIGGASWTKTLSPLNDTVLEYNDHYQRQRLRALQAVDEMLSQLVQELDDAGQLDNTYIFYTTDNGYHISHHAMHPGKECGLDTDIHIPFFVRGPGVPRGEAVNVVTTHTDVSSTLLGIAGVSKTLDGTAIPLRNTEDEVSSRHEHATIEFWGVAVPEGNFGAKSDRHREAGKWEGIYANNTYKGIRIIAEDYSLYYSVWCTNETELFDLKSDPFQTKNIIASGSDASYEIASRPPDAILSRLNSLVMVLKTCKGRACTHPWDVLHPEGGVESLEQSLHESYDYFYDQQPQMWFSDCPMAYFWDRENQDPVRSFEVVAEL